MKQSRVLNQGSLPYCIYFANWSLYETLSGIEIPDGWQAVRDLAAKHSDKGGTTPAFLEGLRVEGLNGFYIQDHKTLNTFAEVKEWSDKGFLVICDFKEIWGIPYHTVVTALNIKSSGSGEVYLKNSYGTEWHQGGYDWSGVNPAFIRGYVVIPVGSGIPGGSGGLSGHTGQPGASENVIPGTYYIKTGEPNAEGFIPYHDPVTGADGLYRPSDYSDTQWHPHKPLDMIKLEQGYGFTDFAKSHPELYTQWNGKHPGWDLWAVIGTPIYSAEMECTVIFAGWGGGFGWCVKTQSGNRIVTYAHLNSLAVQVGQILNDRQPIGFSGASGYYIDKNGNIIPTVTGPHLHWQIDLDGIGPVDPGGFTFR